MTMFRSSLTLLVAIVIGLFAMLALAAETGMTAPKTHVSEVHFRGGYFKQETDPYGRWTERKNNGDITYEFFETASDGKTFELKGVNGKVTLLFDLQAKTIQGEWPGHAMSKIYDVNGVKKLELPEAPAPAVPPKPDPSVHPVPETPIKPHAIAPKDLQRAEYAGGVFERIGDRDWQERMSDGQIYQFKVIGSDAKSLYLHNRDLNIMITLDPSEGLSRISMGGEPLRELYRLTHMSTEAVTPVPPQPDGTLGPDEIAACVASGGYVERAGLLGAERCTKRYQDAGQLCHDSSQCQGQCRAQGNPPIGQPTSGVCQATDNPFGCYTEVVRGQAGAGLCVD